MILIKEVVYAQSYIHFYKMENVHHAHIQTIGIPKLTHVLIAPILTFMTHKLKSVNAPLQPHLNIMENALLVTILIIGMTLLECVLLAQKHINSV